MPGGNNPVHPDKERRRLQRFDLRLPARIETLPPCADPVPVVMNLTTRDISAQGAFFPSERPLEEGTRVRVDLILTPEKLRPSRAKPSLIKVVGTVLRRGAEGMAVAFEKNYQLAPLR